MRYQAVWQMLVRPDSGKLEKMVSKGHVTKEKACPRE